MLCKGNFPSCTNLKNFNSLSTADLQNVSLMSLDENIGKIEANPKEEASVVEVFQDVLDKLSDVGKKDKLLKFFKLVQDGKFPSISKYLYPFKRVSTLNRR
jgi:CRISPR/Cas system-associated endonuclease/helicase Cas3